MKIKWLGHSSFLITAGNGTRIIADPFGDYPGLSYNPIRETSEVVIISHDHGDHKGAKIKGDHKVVTGAGRKEIAGIEIDGLNSYHDTSKGSERGANTVFCVTVDGMRICHMGDLGHDLSESEIAGIGRVDILMIPVGGFYTIDAGTASAICDRIRPRVVFPMHYRTDKCAFPITGVDDFLEGKSDVKKVDTSEVELTSESLPAKTQIVVLKHAQ
ncbi:MAG: MBL fold metallo-hydrolase [Dehalococcoidia bacterium]|nr:MAG: MBL fold metallo-hydrolase [Dehalococcoidia bacterium]